MGEPFVIDEALRRGIGPTEHMPRNSQALVSLRGGKAMPYGVVPWEAPENPLATWMSGAGISVSLPFPQFFRTTQATLLLTETQIYLIDESTWTGALQTVEDYFERASGHDYPIVSSGGAWHVSDAQGCLIVQNATNFILYTAGTFYGVRGFVSRTGCYHHHQGRILLAGFSNTAKSFWTPKWQAVEQIVNTKATSVNLLGTTTLERWIWWSSLLAGNVADLFDPALALYSPVGLGPELVRDSTLRYSGAAWSLTGSGAIDTSNGEIDFSATGTASQTITLSAGTYLLGFELRYSAGTFHADLGGSVGANHSVNGYYWQEHTVAGGTPSLTIHAGGPGSVSNISLRRVLNPGTYGLAKPWIVEAELKNDSNEIPMRWPGGVTVLKSLDKSVIAYCADGVSALTPMVDPPVYGDKALLDASIAGRTAVGGDEGKHLFVDKAGWVYLITSDLQVTPLDYRHLFKNLSNITVAYDSAKDEFHISGQIGATVYSYTYTVSGGMSLSPRCVTSLAVINGKATGVLGPARFTDFELVTHPFDMGYRGLKTITEIEIGCSSGVSNPMTVRLDYRGVQDDTNWQPGTVVTVRKNAVAHTMTSGAEFRLTVNAADYTTVEIDYIKLHWRPEGKVNVRELLGG